MQRFRTTARAVVLLVLVAGLATGCLGRRSRNNVLQPALEQQWRVDLRPLAIEGGADPEQLEAFADALDQGDAELAGTLWQAIRPHVLEGVQLRVNAGQLSAGPDGQLDGGTAGSWLFSIDQFEAGLAKLAPPVSDNRAPIGDKQVASWCQVGVIHA